MEIFFEESLFYVIQLITAGSKTSARQYPATIAWERLQNEITFGRFFRKSARKSIHGRWNSVPKTSLKT
jgi:hypothetical protein